MTDMTFQKMLNRLRFRPYNEVSTVIQTMFCKISWITHSLGQYTLNLFDCENFRDNFQYILKYL